MSSRRLTLHISPPTLRDHDPPVLSVILCYAGIGQCGIPNIYRINCSSPPAGLETLPHHAMTQRRTVYLTRILPEPVMATLRQQYQLISEPTNQPPTPDEQHSGFARAEAVICTLADPITDALLA